MHSVCLHKPGVTAAATAEAPESGGGRSWRDDPAGPGGEDEAAGARRRARARQLGELKVPAAFDFSKSGNLRDWLRQSGQTFSLGEGGGGSHCRTGHRPHRGREEGRGADCGRPASAAVGVGKREG